MVHLRIPSLGVALLVVATCVRSSHAADERRFVQTEFCISFWVDPPLDENADAHYRRIADAHFSVVMGGFGGRSAAAVAKQLRLCETHGLRAIIQPDNETIAAWPTGPACLGYLLKDEPKARDFPQLAGQVKAIHAQHPGQLGFINLYPSHASPRHWGAPSYEEYVRTFLSEVRPDVLCFDRYPLMNPDDDERDGYCENLAVVREHALAAGIPFWNFFNIIPYGRHEDPTESQVAWQIYTSIAYGAKGILYFCYWTPRGPEFSRGGAIITADGRPTHHYDQARRINARIRHLGPTLMKLRSSRVLRIKPGDDASVILKESPIRGITDGDYLIGLFTHEDDRQALLLNNYRFAYTGWPTIELAPGLGGISELDQETGREIPLRDDSPDMPGLQISLDAGAGRLFLFPKS